MTRAVWWLVALWADAVSVPVGLLVKHLPSDEARAIQKAKGAVCANTPPGWADSATFEAKRAGDGWIVIVRRAEGPTLLGRPLTVCGKALFGDLGVGPMVTIDKNGRVVDYSRCEW